MRVFENKEICNKENQCRPLVSIIIPVYNISRYLPQCLDSVISQTYQNIEIIMINDGSTDDSGSICDQYAQRDGRIHVFHTPNRGPGAARNLGLENARGQFVSFIDSDDWIGPQTIEILLGAAQETEADIVIARYCFEYWLLFQKAGLAMWCGTKFSARTALVISVFLTDILMKMWQLLVEL